ncbi:MAG TPA: helix-turn-helix domain-containing protein [Gammaproteobacteria bacterium]|nr:helix-turn-helix domain-containing protein [Gammaproteobacteria bacterium]
MLLNQLSRLGLSGKRGRFYLAALELGEAPVTAIATRAGIGRTTAYDILEGLLSEGLVTQVEKSGRLHVVAEDPAVFLRNLDERRRVIDEVLPEVQAVYSRSAFKPKVRYYAGVEGIRTVMEDTLTCRSGELCGILSMVELLKVPGEAYMRHNIQRRIAAGLKLRVVRNPAEEVNNIWLSLAEELREVRFSPSKEPFTMTTYIYDNKVACISSRQEDFALLIESVEFAGVQKALFETLWAASAVALPQANCEAGG